MAELVGVVVEQQPSGLYRVRLEGGSMVSAHLPAPIDRNFVRLLAGDRVRVELSPADVGRGRIVGKL
jgi:translation initiation factor IF-1